MTSIEQRVSAFARLGSLLIDLGKENNSCKREGSETQKSYWQLNDLIRNLAQYNTWFDEVNVRRMMFALGESLKEDNLKRWMDMYQPFIINGVRPKTIAVIMAGNIPAVGFHDFLSVLITGHKVMAKLSSDDDKLIPEIANLLFSIEPGFKEYIEFTKGTLNSFDAVIATGSNNTSRYFDYYFSKYPHIIRKNRNGIAAIMGDESEVELEFLSYDILDYYGLGCRNVSKLFVPENYDFTKLLAAIAKRTDVSENNKYFNNYEYNKAIFLVNGKEHYDTGNILMKEDAGIASPISVLNYEYYSNLGVLKDVLAMDNDKIQCIVTKTNELSNSVPFGKSQYPELWDYADGVDTIDFLLKL